MIEVLHFEFMQNAIIAGVLVSIVCGIIGTLIVVNRLVFLSGGIAHASYGGIGLAFFTGLPPALGAGLFAVSSALIMGIVSLTNKHRADTVIGSIWALGMALGIVLTDLSPGYNVDLMSYLFGSILAVPRSDLWMMLPLSAGITFIVTVFYKEFLAISYDEEFAFIMGVPVKTLYFLLLVMTALSVVMTIRVVGLILIIALLSIPPYIAEKYTRSLAGMMVTSSILGIIFTVTGLLLSYYFSLTSGAAIILVAGACFFFCEVADKIHAVLTKPYYV